MFGSCSIVSMEGASTKGASKEGASTEGVPMDVASMVSISMGASGWIFYHTPYRSQISTEM